MMKHVAVIGGGIFGATAAMYVARAGHSVDLFEERTQLLQAASGINQYRLHRGYHYARSPETAQSSRDAVASFRDEYGEAVIEGGRHVYAIAREGSAVSGKEFLNFCDTLDLPYTTITVPEFVNPDMVECVIEGVESRFDPGMLRSAVERKLAESGVRVHLETRIESPIESYDKVIIAAYAGINEVLKAVSGSNFSRDYQFEVCEKPVVTLPSSFNQTDLVIMDGPFMCVDPIGRTEHYALGNVVHAIHATNIGDRAVVPEHIVPVLNRGIVEAPSFSRFREFIEHGSRFIPILKEAKQVGSMFTIRTVLPWLEKTDARPTTVTAINDRCIVIFSGKIGNCVAAAREAVALI